MYKVTFVKYPRCFSVHTDHPTIAGHIADFARDNYQDKKMAPSRDRFSTEPGDKYFIHYPLQGETVFSLLVYDEIRTFLASTCIQLYNITLEEVNIDRTIIPVRPNVTFDRHRLNLVEDHPDWTFQNDVVDAVVDSETHSILEVQMGKGKTKMSLKAVVRLQKVAMYVIKKGFIDKWTNDIKENINPRAGELVILGTSTRLFEALKLGRAGLLMAQDKKDVDTKIFIITTHVLEGFIEGYGRAEHDIHPTELCTLLGVDFVIYDEVHILFRMNYCSWLTLTCQRVLDLSATLRPDQTFKRARYRERLPEAPRIHLEIDKFVEVFALSYNVEDHRSRSQMNRMRMYNHTMFEKIIMRNKGMQRRYFEMCDAVLTKLYFDLKQGNEKALVFFATKNMCTLYQQHLAAKHPTLTIGRNIQGDNYDAFVSSDIGISTPLKSGTAVDIPGLLVALNTVASKATEQNLQILGRPRKNKNFTVRYAYTFSVSIPKHVDYHQHRIRAFKDWVKDHRTLKTNFII